MTREEQLNEAWCKYRCKCSTEIMQALAFALRWCDQHPSWMSVEDELPYAEQDDATNLGAFLFYTEPTNENGPFDGRYRTGFYDCASGTYKIRPNHFGDTRVTHWMPMPAPPEKGGEQ